MKRGGGEVGCAAAARDYSTNRGDRPVAKKVKKRQTPDSSLPIFQLKITLQGIEPLIWRRIQVKDCTLDKLHEHIQTK